VTTPNAHLMQASTHIRDNVVSGEPHPGPSYTALCGAGAPWPNSTAFTNVEDATCARCRDVYDALAEKDWERRNLIDIDPTRYAE